MLDTMNYELVNPPTDNDTLLLHETLFHNANGYIGVRSCFEEGYPEGYTSIRGAYINGFYDFTDMKQAEKLYGLVEEKQTILNVADPQGIALEVGGEAYHLFHGEVLDYRRELDMAAGTTTRKVHWRSPQGREIRVESRRMASFARLPLFLMEYKIRPVNYTGECALSSLHQGDVRNFADESDPRVAAEAPQYLTPLAAETADGRSFLTTATSKSGLRVCTAVGHSLSVEGDCSLELQGHSATYRASFPIRAGEEVVLYKYCVFTDSLRYEDCRRDAEAILKAAMEAGPDALFQEQREWLADYWDKARLEIDGDEDLSRAVRFNLYQLIASVGKDAYSNIAAKGLSGEGYEGHYFWDTEMYIQPYFVLTNPAISRGLIAHRYHILDEARKNARMLGHTKGALFPWRTIMGRECSGYFPSGAAQYHINSDIAHAVVDYYLATKDMDFLEEMGAEILCETARLWVDVGVFQDGVFFIHDVTGPDEYTCMVNNNYYTNVSAKYNLEWAVKAYTLLRERGRTAWAEAIVLTPREPEEFARAAACMLLPYDEALGINPQDDSFLQKKRWDLEHTPSDRFPLLLHYHPMHLYRHQVCKQADTVLAHFVYEDSQPLETIRRSFAYYEEITTHDSSLSTCIFSIVASKLGLRDKAYQYFGDSAKLDLFNTHQNTKDGIHTANMGGTYMSIVYGFGGVRLKESGIHFVPALPEQWRRYSFQVLFEGSRIDVEVDGNSVVLQLRSGDAKDIYLYGEPMKLRDSLTVPLKK